MNKDKILQDLGDLGVHFQIELYDEVTSTNDLLKQKVRDGKVSPYHVIVASSQTKGRGRLGRSFFSPQDTGVYLSLYLQENALEESLTTTMQAGVAACQALSDLTGKLLSIKWVNDIYLGRRKVAGILTEGIQLHSQNAWGLIMGIGVNFFPPKEGVPKDLEDKVGVLFEKPIPHVKNHFVSAFLRSMYQMKKEGLAYQQDYRESILRGERRIEVIQKSRTYPADILDVTHQGHLVIRTKEGSIETLSSGEISTRWRSVHES